MRQWRVPAILLLVFAALTASVRADNRGKMPVTAAIGAILENECARYVIGADGSNLSFTDKRTGRDYCAREPACSFARIRKAGRSYNSSAVSSTDGRITAEFGESGVRAVIGTAVNDHYFTLEVLSVNDEQIEELTFSEIYLMPQPEADKSFVGCALALNLRTNVAEIPGPNAHLAAMCYPRLGVKGAKVAIIGCPLGDLRQVMKEVVSSAKDLPHSSLGGPWALENEINEGSYLFNFGGLSEDKVDDWIRLAADFGMNQIDFHGGSSFRFGDCRPNPQTYPKGHASLKAVLDKLHTRGIKAGLHTYAFFIDKSCPWVTPVPDPRLAKDAAFTLAESLSPDSARVPVLESTKDMSAITGFQVRNSVTLQIDDELITYSGISKEPPYAFTGCQRGAYGTKAAAHAQSAKVYHLRECFGLFAPDGDSTLLAEVAAKTAEMFNECGFDMIYLDALDGEDVLDRNYAWHYGSKFVFELCKRLKKPALMEMSTFHHHLWYVRSRMGAWDHPTRSHKRFIDVHCASNQATRRMFLPAHLGWWAVITGPGENAAQIERTYPDDIEYLMCKGIGTDSGFSLMGVNPDTMPGTPSVQKLADIFKRYEGLRHARYFSESIKSKVRVPGDEFTLEQAADGRWQFRRIQYAKHKVKTADGAGAWNTKNRFGRQPVKLRIEALMSAGPYDSPDSVILADFAKPEEFAERAAEKGVTADIKSSSDQVKDWTLSGCYTASSTRPDPNGAWTRIVKVFSPALDLAQRQAIGVWVYGDGQGEILNFQLKSPRHIAGGIGDHYVRIDFTGWRYFELIEPEGGNVSDYSWPYGGDFYGIYREFVNYGQIESLALWFNNLPAGKKVACYVSPVKALPLVKAALRNSRVSVAGKTIVFPVEIESGCYLEFSSMSDCRLYNQNGELLREVKPEGEVPVLAAGRNRVEFGCDAVPRVGARAYVTVISRGEVLKD